ncbi:MAG: potassium-transporting ATPase subunit KdpA [Burkholderiaceae bacterium]|nr:potassium-transporting ATPase subunit KdpA [Burkholderiaceae bacterium]
MTSQMVILLVAYVAAVLTLAVPMGRWLAAVAEGRLARLQRLDGALLRICGARADREQGWRDYTVALLAFNIIGVIVVYALQRLQGALPLNPQELGAIAPDSAFNTAVSFVTNTNWQGYSGEVTMGYGVQMLGLAVQNFLSAATGMAVAFALIRGFARGQPQSGAATIGNFWVDVTRSTLYVLLPLSLVFAVVLSSQGVLQNFKPYTEVSLIDPVAYSDAGPAGADGQPTQVAQTATTQTLPMGPIASQEAIKMVGTNGGGFLNANSAHPFENPTPWVNVMQMLAIFLIPAGLCLAFGQMVGDRRQGWALLIAMTAIFVAAVVAIMLAEQSGNPKLAALGVDQAASVLQSGGNMEGKETRFGIAHSSLFAAVTTAASCGAVNGMHGSFTPLGGAVPMLLMQLGEVVFGGVGSGLYGMLIFAVLAVFLAGLMIGRTPEYLGKKIEPTEMKLVAIAVLMTPMLVLIGTAIAVSTDAGRAGPLNPGAAGYSEILYALSSAANNNGSAFAGLSANTPFYNALLGIAMWIGRFGVIVPVLAIAGTLAAKKRVEDGRTAAMPTHGPLFIVLLVSTVLLVGALTYLPSLALGPVVEQLNLYK